MTAKGYLLIGAASGIGGYVVRLGRGQEMTAKGYLLIGAASGIGGYVGACLGLAAHAFLFGACK